MARRWEKGACCTKCDNTMRADENVQGKAEDRAVLTCTKCNHSWEVHNKQIIKVHRWPKWGYLIRTEYWVGGTVMVQRSAYTLGPDGGEYIGDAGMAAQLCKRKGILPEKADPEHSICSIGKSTLDGKWYGWSHRAICGFGKGDKIYNEHWTQATDQTPFIEHGDNIILNDADAKKAAANFASSVS